MLMEAFEILQSAGQNEDSFVTDFAVYKLLYILTIYVPLAISTFLLSQEYLGAKIACFAPDNFTDAQAQSVDEFCWNNGFWLSADTMAEKSLYTQPHRYYPLYLPIQAVLSMSPIIFWNVMTKAQLLAILKGTEDFLEELLETVTREEDTPVKAEKARERMKHFHQSCVMCCHNAKLSMVGLCRVTWELFLSCSLFLLQFSIYNRKTKEYYCNIPSMWEEPIECTVPILDLLDAVWSINVSCLLMAVTVNVLLLYRLYDIHFSMYQPMFYNSLPYGDTDNFNEKITWDSRWTKDSYLLLTRIFLENNSIMTKAYVLQALKTVSEENEELSHEPRIETKTCGLKDDSLQYKAKEKNLLVGNNVITEDLKPVISAAGQDPDQNHNKESTVRQRKTHSRRDVVTPVAKDYTFLTMVFVAMFFLVQQIQSFE